MAFKLKYLNPVRWVKKGGQAIGGAVKGAAKGIGGVAKGAAKKLKQTAKDAEETLMGTAPEEKEITRKLGEKGQREVVRAAYEPAKQAIEQFGPGFEFPSELVKQLSQEYKPGEIDYTGFKATEDAAVKLLQEQLIPKLASQWSAMGVNPYGDPTFELQKNKLIQDTLAGLAQERSIYGERQQLLGMKGYEQNLSRAQQLANLLQNQEAIKQNKAGFLRETAMTPITQQDIVTKPGKPGLLAQVAPIAGAVIGGMAGGPAGAGIGLKAGQAVGQAMTPQQAQFQQQAKAAQLGQPAAAAMQELSQMQPRGSSIQDLLNQATTAQYEKPGVAASTDMNAYNINQILGQQALQDLKGTGKQRKPSVLGGGGKQQQPMYPSAQSGLAALGYGGQF